MRVAWEDIMAARCCRPAPPAAAPRKAASMAAAVDAPKCQYEVVAQGQTPLCGFTWDIFIEIIWIVEVLMYPSTFLN